MQRFNKIKKSTSLMIYVLFIRKLQNVIIIF